MKNCPICLDDAELRKTDNGWTAGCWSNAHYENPTRVDKVVGYYELGHDLYPLAGMERKTQEEAVDSWNEWRTYFEEAHRNPI